jgi:hypothetical protein
MNSSGVNLAGEHMTSQRIAVAMDVLRQNHPDWQSNAEHVRALRNDAQTRLLGDILARPVFVTAAHDYPAHSDTAAKRQTAHRRNASLAAHCGFWAAITAGLMLYLDLSPSSSQAGFALAAAYVVLIAVALFASAYVIMRKPYRDWMAQRSSAERLRIAYFHDLLGGQPLDRDTDPAMLATLKLEYVRAFLLDDQRDWFARKAREAAREAGNARKRRIAAFVLVLLAVLPILVSALAEPTVSAYLPTSITGIATEVMALGASSVVDARLLAFCGVAGGALQTWVSSIGASSLADRNALIYGRMVQTLDELAENELPAARRAAQSGRIEAVEPFWRKLSFALIAEQEGWNDALQTAQLLTIDTLAPPIIDRA